MVYSVCCLVLPEPTPPSKPEPVQKPAREPAKPSPAASTDTRGRHYLFSAHTSPLSLCSNSFSHQHPHTLSPLKKVHLCCDVCLLIMWSICLRFLCDLITRHESHLVFCFLWRGVNAIMIAGLLYRNTEDLIPESDKSAWFLFFSFTVMTSRLFLFIWLFIPFAHFFSLSSLLLFCSVFLSHSLCEVVCPSLLPATQRQTQGLWVYVAVVTAGGGIAMETIMRGR